MSFSEVVSTVSLIVTVVVAVTIPRMTFRLALRQEHVRWLREQRAQLYVDILVEAYAEMQYFEHTMLDDDTRQAAAKHFTDLRQSPAERARLGARGTALAAEEVNAAFNRLQGSLARQSWGAEGTAEARRTIGRVEAGKALDELQSAIRHELGSAAARERRPRRVAP